MLTAEQFTQWLREALNHLYDPEKLERSPLVRLFGIQKDRGSPLVLRRILKDTIETLEPEAGVPIDSRPWRIYEVLSYRYVQQFTQREVAEQMGLSVRHLRREQEAALEVLSTQLWNQFELTKKRDVRVDHSETVQRAFFQDTPPVSEELAWLKGSTKEQCASLANTISKAMSLAEPLVTRYDVQMRVDLDDTLPELAIHPLALRQVFLSLLTMAVHRVPGGRIAVSAKSLAWEVEISLQGTAPRPGPKPAVDTDIESLDMACRLVEMYAGDVEVSAKEEPFIARLRVPSLEKLPVLAIDDNEDTLRLFSRYTSGTRYHLVGARDPKEALDLLEAVSPQIIVLDIMMPEVDGWELLKRLAQHTLGKDTHIVVCTVLSQKELALSLGASDFVHKPVSQRSFLEILDRQVPTREKEPH